MLATIMCALACPCTVAACNLPSVYPMAEVVLILSNQGAFMTGLVDCKCCQWTFPSHLTPCVMHKDLVHEDLSQTEGLRCTDTT
jgi:hypothetical protein